MTRNFTGRHMLALMIGFFGIVIAVNLFMATSASRTFSGTVVDNSYVASQQFNKWLARAHAQEQSGWQAAARLDDGHVMITLSVAGKTLRGARLRAVAERYTDGTNDSLSRFVERRPGEYVAANRLTPGRWRVRIEAAHAGASAVFLEDVGE